MEEKRLTPSTVDLIPDDGGGPSHQTWWDRVWQKVTNWFDNVSSGGIYDTKVDRTHYDRWWWSWHLISDASEIMGGFAGWAGRVYDYFQNWINPAREQLSEKVGRIQQVIREAPEGGFWGGVKDTFDTWGATFASFRSNTATFIYDRLPQWLKDAASLVNTWQTQISYFFTNLYTTVKDFLGRIWAWIYEHVPQDFKDIWNNAKTWWDWLKLRWDDFTRELDWFLDDPDLYIYSALPQWIKDLWDLWNRTWGWIYEHIPQDIKDIWNNAKTWWDWLSLRWDNFTRELDWFLDDPYLYLTSKLKVWIEGWRDYILGIVNDLFTQFAKEIILHLLDWMGYVAPPIEALDEMAFHSSSFTDMLDEWAKAWKELKETWVKEAMVMMKAFAAELRGEEEMDLLTPSETILQYWQMLTPEQIELIVSPPIKG